MKKNYVLFLFLTLLCSSIEMSAQTFWTGPNVTVTKANFADWLLPANQDALSPSVILTRANTRGIFNIAQENVFDNVDYLSPIGTEWATGSISSGVGTLTFSTWDINNGSDPTSKVGIPQVLHLIADNIYIDITFTSWTSGAGGGGFTYVRSSSPLSTNDTELHNRLKLFPNPSSEFVQITGLNKAEKYTIFNVTGSNISSGTVSNNEKINIKNLENGLYFLKLNNGNTLKFLKQ